MDIDEVEVSQPVTRNKRGSKKARAQQAQGPLSPTRPSIKRAAPTSPTSPPAKPKWKSTKLDKGKGRAHGASLPTASTSSTPLPAVQPPVAAPASAPVPAAPEWTVHKAKNPTQRTSPSTHIFYRISVRYLSRYSLVCIGSPRSHGHPSISLHVHCPRTAPSQTDQPPAKGERSAQLLTVFYSIITPSSMPATDQDVFMEDPSPPPPPPQPQWVPENDKILQQMQNDPTWELDPEELAQQAEKYLMLDQPAGPSPSSPLHVPVAASSPLSSPPPSPSRPSISAGIKARPNVSRSSNSTPGPSTSKAHTRPSPVTSRPPSETIGGVDLAPGGGGRFRLGSTKYGKRKARYP